MADKHDSQQGDRRGAGAAILLVILVGISFQTGSALVVRVVQAVGSLEAAWLRSGFAALLLGALALALRGRRRRRAGNEQRSSRRQWPWFLALSASLAAMNLSFYAAIDRVPVGIAVAIEFLGPLAVAVLGARRASDWLWIILAGGGVALLAGPGGSVDLRGLGLAALSGLFWGLYLVIAKRLVTGYDPVVVTAMMVGGAALLLTPFVPLDGIRLLARPEAVGLAVIVATISSAVPYLFELIALRRVPAGTYGVLLSIEPAIAATAAFIILGQRLSTIDMVAIAAIVVAAAGASWAAARRIQLPDVPAPPDTPASAGG